MFGVFFYTNDDQNWHSICHQLAYLIISALRKRVVVAYVHYNIQREECLKHEAPNDPTKQSSIIKKRNTI